MLLYVGVCAQDLEPRRYAALPKGLNALAVGYAWSKGNVVSDAALPISDFTMTTHVLLAGYLRSFRAWGKLARISVGVPFTTVEGDAKVRGRDTNARRTGFNDAQLRIGVNLTGSPAEDARTFARFRQETIFGVSLAFNLPTGLYHNDKVINTGTNRWAFKPEIGISQRFRRWYAEMYTGVWFYAHNDEYPGHRLLEQRPLFSIQGHGCYNFRNQMWVSVNGTWFKGGQTIVDGRETGSVFDNWRVGATWSTPLGKWHSIKLQFHVGAFATRSYNYNTISLGYQYIFF